MIKFPNSNREYVQFKDCRQIFRHNAKVWICPYCKTHEQGECNEVNDCKTIIYDDELTTDGKLKGGNTQCGCYSEEHGRYEK